MLESYLEFIVSAFIGVKNLTWNNAGEKFASVLAILNVAFFVLMPMLTHFMIVKNKHKIHDEKFIRRFGALFEEFRTNSHPALLYNYYFLVRRIFYAASLIFLAFWSTS